MMNFLAHRRSALPRRASAQGAAQTQGVRRIGRRMVGAGATGGQDKQGAASTLFSRRLSLRAEDEPVALAVRLQVAWEVERRVSRRERKLR